MFTVVAGRTKRTSAASTLSQRGGIITRTKHGSWRLRAWLLLLILARTPNDPASHPSTSYAGLRLKEWCTSRTGSKKPQISSSHQSPPTSSRHGAPHRRDNRLQRAPQRYTAFIQMHTDLHRFSYSTILYDATSLPLRMVSKGRH
jgi:hypothetical protein